MKKLLTCEQVREMIKDKQIKISKEEKKWFDNNNFHDEGVLIIKDGLIFYSINPKILKTLITIKDDNDETYFESYFEIEVLKELSKILEQKLDLTVINFYKSLLKDIAKK